jgi:tyrosyl-tRNA synthetase
MRSRSGLKAAFHPWHNLAEVDLVCLTGGMRILSGIQPSGALHLGNYFGMMNPAIELQDQGEALYFIADYHSMTSLFDAAERRRNTMDVALDLLACGFIRKNPSSFASPIFPRSPSSRGF